MKCHPDKNPDNEAAAEQFKRINYAHAVLTDEKKRKIYDAYGTTGLDLADKIGEDNVMMYVKMNKPWVKVSIRCVSS